MVAADEDGEDRGLLLAGVVPAGTRQLRRRGRVGPGLAGPGRAAPRSPIEALHVAILGRHRHAAQVRLVAHGLEISAAEQQVGPHAVPPLQQLQRLVQLVQGAMAAPGHRHLHGRRLSTAHAPRPPSALRKVRTASGPPARPLRSAVRRMCKASDPPGQPRAVESAQLLVSRGGESVSSNKTALSFFHCIFFFKQS